MNVFRFLYKFFVWRKGKKEHLTLKTQMLQAYSGIERLQQNAQLNINFYEPLVEIDMTLHLALSADRQQYQNFLAKLHSYINYLRAAFNGAASEGLAVSPLGADHLPPIQPDDAIGCHVVAGHALICVGAFNMYDHRIETYRGTETHT